MTRDLEAERRDLADYLRRQLAALDHGPAARRARFVLLSVHCRDCSERLAEVVELAEPVGNEPVRVLRFRKVADHPSVEPLPLDASLGERTAHRRSRPARIRSDDDRSFFTLPAQLPDDGAVWLVHAACGCGQHTLAASAIFDDLEAGIRRRARTRDTPS